MFTVYVEGEEDLTGTSFILGIEENSGRIDAKNEKFNLNIYFIGHLFWNTNLLSLAPAWGTALDYSDTLERTPIPTGYKYQVEEKV